MSAATPTLRRAYDLHGVTIVVSSDDPAPLEAMDFRLRGFAPAPEQRGRCLRFEFTSRQPVRPPAESGRPVYETPHGTLSYFPAQDLLAGELGGVSLSCRAGAGLAVISAPAFHERSLYFATHPVATVAMMELMERLGRFSLHAACLADADGNGLLLSGPSGAGKSTLALALARAGMGFLGDDVVFLERPASGPGALEALGFADALGLGTFATERFPELTRLADQPAPAGFPKRLHRAEDLFGRAPVEICTPRAIVFTEVAADQPSTLIPLGRGAALVRLVPDVLVTQGPATQAHVDAIGALLAQVRCYTARSGYDLERAAEMIRGAVC